MLSFVFILSAGVATNVNVIQLECNIIIWLLYSDYCTVLTPIVRTWGSGLAYVRAGHVAVPSRGGA
jgi:hypothetical protein